MGKIKEWIKEHPVEAGAGVVGIIIFFLILRNSGGSSNAGGTNANDVQIAQIQAQANAVNAQAMAQQNAAQIAANAQTAQVNDAATAQEDQYLAQVAETKIAGQTQDVTTTTEGNIYNEIIKAGENQDTFNAQLESQQLSNQKIAQGEAFGLLSKDIFNKGGQGGIANFNSLGLILGEPVPGANSALATNSMANASIWSSLFGGISNGASSIVHSLFG